MAAPAELAAARAAPAPRTEAEPGLRLRAPLCRCPGDRPRPASASSTTPPAAPAAERRRTGCR
eukprot:3728647-Alexandrium_andersonii.AAC.1